MNQTDHIHDFGYDSLFIVPGTTIIRTYPHWAADIRFRCFACGYAPFIRVWLRHPWRPADVGPNIRKAYETLTEQKVEADVG